MTTATNPQAPAWDRFRAMSDEVHEMLIGAAQCRNHLEATLEEWAAMDDREKQEAIREALHRLERVGI